MKVQSTNMIKLVTKQIKRLSRKGTTLSVSDEISIVMYALAYSPNHSAYMHGVAPSTVYTLLRSIGLENAIGSYHRKPSKAVKAKLKSVA